MNRDEILEKNKISNKDEEDEMEQYISGKAGINAKIVFSLVIIAVVLFKHYKGISTGDVWGIFMAYAATESIYKYYYLRYKKLLLSGILFSIGSISALITFIISTYR
ncbi:MULTISPECIES: DUF6442 family protein [unclassified Clostridium]|uniref:DUF6442 family protein n=1 Tax=unclassified Clostridium TaxID=2614128 RepID=UPI0002984CB3|nr:MULTISPECIES: DUF6442 family protein [unclassified Clostridium]EKQ56526.1 MAG: hypothetical protein A370_01889 [Clostridium sp. Maddingley MBC34-26]